MDLITIINTTIKKFLKEGLETRLLNKKDIVNLGGLGLLDKAFERYILIDKIVGEDDEPNDWTDDKGIVNRFNVGTKINSSIEVKYSYDDDLYYLQDGNHRLKQAKINGEKYIRAFIEPDRGRIGNDAKLSI